MNGRRGGDLSIPVILLLQTWIQKALVKSSGQLEGEKSLVPRNVLILHKFREGKIGITEAGADATSE